MAKIIREELDEMYDKCKKFFDGLAEHMGDGYVVVESCNGDRSAYLVPIYEEDQITYHSKPTFSYRISDHWNWKTSFKKNPDEHYIQCYSKDFPWCKKRNAPGKASNPILACSVCFYGPDNLYHVIYGQKFDRKTKTWSWVECDPKNVVINIDWCY